MTFQKKFIETLCKMFRTVDPDFLESLDGVFDSFVVLLPSAAAFSNYTNLHKNVINHAINRNFKFTINRVSSKIESKYEKVRSCRSSRFQSLDVLSLHHLGLKLLKFLIEERIFGHPIFRFGTQVGCKMTSRLRKLGYKNFKMVSTRSKYEGVLMLNLLANNGLLSLLLLFRFFKVLLEKLALGCELVEALAVSVHVGAVAKNLLQIFRDAKHLGVSCT